MEILPKPLTKKRWRRNRNSPYLTIVKTLKKLWAISNYYCGKRLVPMIPVYISSLGVHHELHLTPSEKKLLKRISPATVDRFLKYDRRRINPFKRD